MQKSFKKVTENYTIELNSNYQRQLISNQVSYKRKDEYLILYI